MRILNTQQIRALDAQTILHEPIASIDLMERASRAFADWFIAHIEVSRKTGVVCGTGNNGGDGLAIARMLYEWGYSVKVWVLRGCTPESDDFRTNYGRLPESIQKAELHSEDDALSLGQCDIVIDAIFGSGLSRPAMGLYASAIHQMNEAAAVRVAVDIASGLMADSPAAGAIVKADYTVSFGLPKLAFFFPQSYPFTGDWTLVDIGLDKEFINNADTPYFFTRLKDVRKFLRRRSKNDHKGTFGHALLIAGGYGKMGAAVLAARGALRAGVGLLTVHVPACGYDIIQSVVPEAMAQVDDDDKVYTMPPDTGAYATIGIGPGLGQDARSVKALERLLENAGKPMVFDADALNMLSANRHLLNLIPPGSILTPHPKEFERLAGPWKDDFERLALQRQLAISLKSVVVLKGAHTAVANARGEVYFNSTGNPGMATGGTGDVLTGVIMALLAQNYTPDEAAIAGVFLHGLSADMAVSGTGIHPLIASDLIAHLPAAFAKVFRK